MILILKRSEAMYQVKEFWLHKKLPADVSQGLDLSWEKNL